MHDPMTVAFKIHGPRGWLHKWRREHADRYDHKDPRFSYLSPVLTIWHNDPETDGSDDSCGYTNPKAARGLRERAEKIIASEWEYMFGKYPYRYQTPSAFEVVFAVWGMFAWRLFKQRRLSSREIEEIASLASNPVDNLRSVIFDATRSPENAKHLGRCVLRAYLRVHRRWYQKPKWHAHHWKIQIHALQAFKRWAFSHCDGCGKRFAWGYSPTSAQWHGSGPQWFKSEQKVYHSDCVPSRKKVAA
jgi:hypothetical protein